MPSGCWCIPDKKECRQSKLELQADYFILNPNLGGYTLVICRVLQKFRVKEKWQSAEILTSIFFSASATEIFTLCMRCATDDGAAGWGFPAGTLRLLLTSSRSALFQFSAIWAREPKLVPPLIVRDEI